MSLRCTPRKSPSAINYMRATCWHRSTALQLYIHTQNTLSKTDFRKRSLFRHTERSGRNIFCFFFFNNKVKYRKNSENKNDDETPRRRSHTTASLQVSLGQPRRFEGRRNDITSRDSLAGHPSRAQNDPLFTRTAVERNARSYFTFFFDNHIF